MAEDESIKVKRGGFFWTAVNQARFIFGMHVSYSLPLEHPLAVFVERFAEAARSGNLSQLVELLAELTEAPPAEEVSALLLKILRQMRNPALNAADMRTLCALYVGLVELLPYEPWLYRLVSSEVEHWTDATPDRLLKVLLVVYENRKKLRTESHGCFVVDWRGMDVQGHFEKRERGYDDFTETDARMPAVVRAGGFTGPVRIGPQRFTLPMRQLPAKSTSDT